MSNKLNHDELRAIIAIGKLIEENDEPITYNQLRGELGNKDINDVLYRLESKGLINTKSYSVEGSVAALIWTTDKFSVLPEEDEIKGVLKAITDKTIKDNEISEIKNIAKRNYDFFISAKDSLYDQSKKYNFIPDEDRVKMYDNFIKRDNQTVRVIDRILGNESDRN